jgi:hypothetical protein
MRYPSSFLKQSFGAKYYIPTNVANFNQPNYHPSHSNMAPLNLFSTTELATLSTFFSTIPPNTAIVLTITSIAAFVDKKFFTHLCLALTYVLKPNWKECMAISLILNTAKNIEASTKQKKYDPSFDLIGNSLLDIAVNIFFSWISPGIEKLDLLHQTLKSAIFYELLHKVCITQSEMNKVYTQSEMDKKKFINPLTALICYTFKTSPIMSAGIGICSAIVDSLVLKKKDLLIENSIKNIITGSICSWLSPDLPVSKSGPLLKIYLFLILLQCLSNIDQSQKNTDQVIIEPTGEENNNTKLTGEEKNDKLDCESKN